MKKEDEKFCGFGRGSLVPEKSIYGESPALAVSENVLGFIIRARRRPQITPNDRQLTKNTTSKNSKRRGYTRYANNFCQSIDRYEVHVNLKKTEEIKSTCRPRAIRATYLQFSFYRPRYARHATPPFTSMIKKEAPEKKTTTLCATPVYRVIDIFEDN